MKVTHIAAACAALCSVSAFAATYDPTATTPANVLMIAGASAQKNALLAAVPGTVFDTTAHGVLYISGPNGSVGWLGDAKAAYGGGTLLVIYQSKNGSAAGLNQVISAGTPEAEATVLSLPASGCGSKSAVSAPNAATEQITCSGGSAAHEADMALADVHNNEFAPGLLSTGSALKPASTTTSTALEGFGVVVNSVLYDALLAQNILEGKLPASCATATASTLVVGVGNGPCQPGIRQADYASLVTSGGQYNSYTALVPDQTGRDITVCRRDDLSGTQAASNIFFLNSVCGLKGYGGALLPATNADSGIGTDGTYNYTVVDAANNATPLSENCVWSGSATGTAAYAGYAAGVVGLGEKDSVDSATPQSSYPNAKYYYVKLDCCSPNYTAAGVYDPTHRANILSGCYKFVYEMGAYVKSTTSTASGNGKIARAIADDISKASLSNLTGIAYITGGTYGDGKTGRYTRGGNNCAPLQ
jgi:hypothetical protein